MAFKLSLYPWVHIAHFDGKQWTEQYVEKDHLTPDEEAALDEKEYAALTGKRNTFTELPLINYSTQYGLSCFEGMKALPQKDGSLKMFRPDRNCARMAASMKGLRMPPVDEKLLLKGIRESLSRNAALGFTPKYNTEWEKDTWQNAASVYIRPFTYSEPGIGVNLCKNPWVITAFTTVSAYFTPGENKAVTSTRVRATPGGTGWIKTSANYVASALAKNEAIDNGYMESIFLDAKTGKNVEEGSSCNFFAVFPGNILVTPALHDTILPGITRESVITLARDRGLKVEEADLPIEKVINEAEECFVTGTAAGITPLGSVTHQGRERKLSSMNDNSTAVSLLKELKGIQYGALEDKHGWMYTV
ncbi:MAG: branched chain amino acid aminotransferase [Spirochaetales bacterium]|nr:MAG: branched chain amino acid aminotransferase [Spirochaetales bacterium]